MKTLIKSKLGLFITAFVLSFVMGSCQKPGQNQSSGLADLPKTKEELMKKALENGVLNNVDTSVASNYVDASSFSDEEGNNSLAGNIEQTATPFMSEDTGLMSGTDAKAVLGSVSDVSSSTALASGFALSEENSDDLCSTIAAIREEALDELPSLKSSSESEEEIDPEDLKEAFEEMSENTKTLISEAVDTDASETFSESELAPFILCHGLSWEAASILEKHDGEELSEEEFHKLSRVMRFAVQDRKREAHGGLSLEEREALKEELTEVYEDLIKGFLDTEIQSNDSESFSGLSEEEKTEKEEEHFSSMLEIHDNNEDEAIDAHEFSRMMARHFVESISESYDEEADDEEEADESSDSEEGFDVCEQSKVPVLCERVVTVMSENEIESEIVGFEGFHKLEGLMREDEHTFQKCHRFESSSDDELSLSENLKKFLAASPDCEHVGGKDVPADMPQEMQDRIAELEEKRKTECEEKESNLDSAIEEAFEEQGLTGEEDEIEGETCFALIRNIEANKKESDKEIALARLDEKGDGLDLEEMVDFFAKMIVVEGRGDHQKKMKKGIDNPLAGGALARTRSVMMSETAGKSRGQGNFGLTRGIQNLGGTTPLRPTHGTHSHGNIMPANGSLGDVAAMGHEGQSHPPKNPPFPFFLHELVAKEVLNSTHKSGQSYAESIFNDFATEDDDGEMKIIPETIPALHKTFLVSLREHHESMYEELGE